MLFCTKIPFQHFFLGSHHCFGHMPSHDLHTPFHALNIVCRVCVCVCSQ